MNASRTVVTTSATGAAVTGKAAEPCRSSDTRVDSVQRTRSGAMRQTDPDVGSAATPVGTIGFPEYSRLVVPLHRVDDVVVMTFRRRNDVDLTWHRVGYRRFSPRPRRRPISTNKRTNVLLLLERGCRRRVIDLVIGDFDGDGWSRETSTAGFVSAAR